jgi:protein involved in polysaccharide export with SLBB domain
MIIFRVLMLGTLIFVPVAVLGQEGGGLVAPVGSGTGGGLTGTGLEGAVDAETYVLGPGDSLLVSLTGVASYVYPTVITPEGKLFLMMPVSDLEITPSAAVPVFDAQPVARVHVSGMSIAEAQEKTNETASKYFRNTEIILTLMAFRKLRVSVVGDVFRAGVFTATPVTRVSEVVNWAQLQGTASRAHIELVRGDSVCKGVNLYDFELTGDPSSNPYLRDGDIIRVPSMKKRVTVRGAVYGSGVYALRVSALTAEQTRTSEGTYELEEGDRVTDLVRKAGGIAPWADLENSYIERYAGPGSPARKIRLDLKNVLTRGEESADLLLDDGDILVIPTLEDVVYVEGAVTTPGAVQFQAGLGVMDYIGLAGGPTERASVGGVRIRTSEGQIMSAKENPEVKRGDTIEVPRVAVKWWEDYVLIGSAVTSVLIAWLSITD